ncbi:MAG TPA: anaerobic ribonucleoside-triphosphate reductase [Spirochaetota bacterium]|nr:anaerobic ribonucleoside-triphosphate reductase [Spirochaetota bacterium]HOS33732.1 anaerobic ribonucleoside-triphosphate reductase [Spirochaetota bacterium]HOS56674.1 anaerobic ribonucleoside-triphosphate reductase [Spirochaetota bacterium]HPK61401.1 anaerobic ribonucleoside-triphosphate reductase [Spirochaetota bacterium]HQF78981.1 anaerobic ribonucleoside-triphosphate reductase [Spirochaetota bacterium]
MKTLKEIDNRISLLESRYEEVKGTETEVYTRIVGYHRSVVNWNRGKKEEYGDRVTFNVERSQISQKIDSIKTVKVEADGGRECAIKIDANLENVAFYKLFHSQFCINCPPVVRFMENVNVPGEDFDVSSDLGMGIAAKYNVLATPTVILFDSKDNVIGRVSSVEELKTVFVSEEKASAAV